MWQRRAAFACRRSPEREGERERESKRETHTDTSDTEVDHPDTAYLDKSLIDPSQSRNRVLVST